MQHAINKALAMGLVGFESGHSGSIFFLSSSRSNPRSEMSCLAGEFGLDRDGIYDRFGEYLQTYQVSRDAQA